MIVKGRAQGQPGRLAKHLCRTDHNERVRVLGIDGLNAQTIPDALRELDDLGAAAETRRTLYHGIIAPRVNEQLDDAQRAHAVRRMAEAMGLENQPHIVIGHLKTGHGEHFHVIWSRIDQEHQRGISDSHNYRKHEELARSLETELGLAHTRGAHSRDKGQEPRPERTPAHWEMQQQGRTGRTVAEAKATITEAWRTTKTGAAFLDALSQEGFAIARGDRRDFVLVDEAGGVHSLARRVEGAKARDIRERMDGISPDGLDDVSQAQRRQKQLREAAALEAGKPIVLSVVERMRLEEREAGRNATGARPPMPHTDREISAAVRMLERLGTQTNVVGLPVALRKGTGSAPAEPVQSLVPSPEPPKPPRRESTWEKLDREAREAGQAPVVVKIAPKQEHRNILQRLMKRPDEREDGPRF